MQNVYGADIPIIALRLNWGSSGGSSEVLKVGVVRSESENWGKRSMVSSATKRCIQDGAMRPICHCNSSRGLCPCVSPFPWPTIVWTGSWWKGQPTTTLKVEGDDSGESVTCSPLTCPPIIGWRPRRGSKTKARKPGPHVKDLGLNLKWNRWGVTKGPGRQFDLPISRISSDTLWQSRVGVIWREPLVRRQRRMVKTVILVLEAWWARRWEIRCGTSIGTRIVQDPPCRIRQLWDVQLQVSIGNQRIVLFWKSTRVDPNHRIWECQVSCVGVEVQVVMGN